MSCNPERDRVVGEDLLTMAVGEPGEYIFQCHSPPFLQSPSVVPK